MSRSHDLPDPAAESAAAAEARALFARVVSEPAGRSFADALRDAQAARPDLAAELDTLAERWRIFEGLAVRAPSSDGAEPPSDLARLAETDRYEPREALGSGGMSDVVLAWDTTLRREVAMKILRRDEDAPGSPARELQRFLREAELMASLAHPSVVPVHDLAVDREGRVFFTMEVVRGRTLHEVLEAVRGGDPGWTREAALRSVLAVCHAVAHAHARGIVHRDLKPSNVMVGPFGETYVMDWGIAHRAGTRDRHDLRLREPPGNASAGSLTTIDGVAVGTPSFLAPEHARGELDRIGPRTDVYAVGCILYHLLTGRPPYQERAHDDARSVLRRVRAGPPRPILEIARDAPPELVAIAERAMRREPAERYESMLELAHELEAFLEGRVVRSYRSGPLAELWSWARRNRLVAALAVSSCTAIGVVAAIALAYNRKLAAARVELRAVQVGQVQRLAADDVADHAYAAAARGLASVDADPRGWDWRHLSARADRAERVIRAHDAPVHALVSAPDGFASADVSGRVVLHDARSLDELRRIELDVPLRSLAFLPDGDRMLVGRADGVLELRSAADGAVLARTDSAGFEVVGLAVDARGAHAISAHERWPLTAWAGDRLVEPDHGYRSWRILPHGLERAGSRSPQSAALCVGFLPGGARALVVRADPDPDLAPWTHAVGLAVADADLGTVGPRIGARRERIHSLAIDPAGRRCALTSYDGTIAMHAIESGAEIWSARTGVAEDGQHDHRIAFSPDGERVAHGGESLAVVVRSAADGAILARLPGAPSTISGILFLPEGRLVASSLAGDLRVFDLKAPEPITDFPHPFWVSAVAVSPDGLGLATACRDGATRIFDLRSGRLEREHRGDAPEPAISFARSRSPRGLAWSPDGVHLAVAEPADPGDRARPDRLRLLRAATGDTAWVVELEAHLVRLWFRGDEILGAGVDGRLHAWSAADGRPLGAFACGDEAIVSPDGRRVAVLGPGRTVRVLERASGAEIARFDGHRFDPCDAAWSPDGRRICSTGMETYKSRDPEVRVWDATTGAELRALTGLDVIARRVAWSPDGTRIAAGCQDGRVVLWDARTGVMTFRQAHGTRIDALAWSPDGRHLVASSGTDELASMVRVWSASPER